MYGIPLGPGADLLHALSTMPVISFNDGGLVSNSLPGLLGHTSPDINNRISVSRQCLS